VSNLNSSKEFNEAENSQMKSVRKVSNLNSSKDYPELDNS
jgi:hypothetical protein